MARPPKGRNRAGPANALIGFMNWEGYNYEDAVLLSEKLVKEDIYTSIHMEFESAAAKTTGGRTKSPATSRTSARTR